MSGREREREVVSRADRYPVCIPVRCTLSLSPFLSLLPEHPPHTHSSYRTRSLSLSLFSSENNRGTAIFRRHITAQLF